jgi:flagellar motor switch protein FliG
MMVALAQEAVAAVQRSGVAAPRMGSSVGARTDHLTGMQKAAIVMGVLVAEGVNLPLSSLPADMQAMLAQTMAQMRLIDRATLNAVVAEYVDMLEQVGLSFPDGIDGALALLDGRLDDAATRQLRALSGPSGTVDPWNKLDMAEDAELLALLQAESTVVGAVMLARLSVERAAKLLTLLPQEQAQDLAMTVARTEDIAPDAVARIGAALAAQLGTRAPRAFAVPPPKRVGDLLNLSPPALRDRLLAGFESRDQDFARDVRKAIFTFQDIPLRLSPRDVGTLMREVDAADVLTLLSLDDPADRVALGFLLENMSKRLADGLREDASTLPAPMAAARDDAMGRITGVIRRLVDAGGLSLRSDG